MEGQAHDQGVRKGVGNLVQVKKDRHLGFPPDAVQAFGNVEHQVPAPAGNQGGGKLFGMADPLGDMPLGTEGLFDRGHGVLAVEFGGLQFRVALGQVFRAQVIGQADLYFHRRSFILRDPLFFPSWPIPKRSMAGVTADLPG